MNRVRSLITPKRSPEMDAMEHLIDTHDGRNNEQRPMPALDIGQVSKMLIADAIKEPCYVCKEKSDVICHFQVPQGLNLLGQKVVLYGLCYGCKLTPSAKAIAEGKLILALQAENKQALTGGYHG